MGRLLRFTFLSAMIIACKKDDYSPVPYILVGKWKMVASEKPVNSGTEWQNTPAKDSIYLRFSAYGEVIDSGGNRIMCGPTALEINGKPYKIKFKSPVETGIYLGLCAQCDTWNIALNGNEIVLNNCSPSYRKKYVKQ
jgi:hypothetical protein